jgi:rare lipoprotein A (peptidoglycan hydrolase)
MTYRVLIAILLALVIGFVAGVELTKSRTLPPAPTPSAFQPFPTYDAIPASPTPIAGLHDYAAPLRSAPTASPTPPTARPKLVPAAGHTSSGSGTRTISRSSKGALGGYATWYGTGPDGLYAAAGPALRAALGRHWRGSHVLVCRSTKCVEVRLNDWCACGPRHGYSTLLDLSDEAFAALAPLSRGVIRVAVDLP